MSNNMVELEAYLKKLMVKGLPADERDKILQRVLQLKEEIDREMKTFMLETNSAAVARVKREQNEVLAMRQQAMDANKKPIFIPEVTATSKTYGKNFSSVTLKPNAQTAQHMQTNHANYMSVLSQACATYSPTTTPYVPPSSGGGSPAQASQPASSAAAATTATTTATTASASTSAQSQQPASAPASSAPAQSQQPAQQPAPSADTPAQQPVSSTAVAQAQTGPTPTPAAEGVKPILIGLHSVDEIPNDILGVTIPNREAFMQNPDAFFKEHATRFEEMGYGAQATVPGSFCVMAENAHQVVGVLTQAAVVAASAGLAQEAVTINATTATYIQQTGLQHTAPVPKPAPVAPEPDPQQQQDQANDDSSPSMAPRR